MKTPTFDADGKDKTTFAPFMLVDGRNSKWKDVRLSFHDWAWFDTKYATDKIDGYYLNGYGIQGLVQAARVAAGLPTEAEGIHYDSEGDTCFMHFTDFDEAVRTAELAAEMINDPAKLREMIRVARENGLED